MLQSRYDFALPCVWPKKGWGFDISKAPPLAWNSTGVANLEAHSETQLNCARGKSECPRVLFLLHPSGGSIVKVQAAEAGAETAVRAVALIVEKIENIEVRLDPKIVDDVGVLNLDRPCNAHSEVEGIGGEWIRVVLRDQRYCGRYRFERFELRFREDAGSNQGLTGWRKMARHIRL